MSTRLRIIDYPTSEGGLRLPQVDHNGEPCRDPATDELLPGCMFRVEDMDSPDRENWEIVLPNHAGSFHTNMHSADGPRWEVTGEPPNITVSPSINAYGPGGEGGLQSWHGWIKDGEMTP